MNTKEIEAISRLYTSTIGALIEREKHDKDYPKEELSDERLQNLHQALEENETLSAFLIGNGIQGVKDLIAKLENDIFLSHKDLKIYFGGTPVELNQFVERVLIQYLPVGNLGDDDKRKQRELLNIREQFVPEWEETLYKLLLRFIENKSEEFNRYYDDFRFRTALHGLSKHELTSHHFSGQDKNVLKAVFANIAQDRGFKNVDGKLQYEGVNIALNDLLNKVIVPHIPQSQSFTSMQYTVDSTSSSSSLLGEIGDGFREVGAVVTDFFRTFLSNDEQGNERKN